MAGFLTLSTRTVTALGAGGIFSPISTIMPLSSLFEWLARTEFATAIGRSPYLMGLLSSVHLLGLTLIVGSTIVSCLRCFGALLSERPVWEVTKPTGMGVVLGFAATLASGFLMFAPRAATAFKDSAFQTKMILLLAAVVFHFTLYRCLARGKEMGPSLLRLTGAAEFTLWFGVGCAGCWFAVFD